MVTQRGSYISFTTQLFAGAVYDSYKLSVYVQVYDSKGACIIYEINQNITVIPDFTDFDATKDKLISGDPNFYLNMMLKQGSFLKSIQIMQSISSLLNEQSLSDKLGLKLDSKLEYNFPHIYGPLAYFKGVNSVRI
jgi:hypothetical protein